MLRALQKHGFLQAWWNKAIFIHLGQLEAWMLEVGSLEARGLEAGGLGGWGWKAGWLEDWRLDMLNSV